MIASSFSFDLCGMNGQGNNLVVQSTTAPSELKEEKKKDSGKRTIINKHVPGRARLNGSAPKRPLAKKAKKQTLPACLYPSIEKL